MAGENRKADLRHAVDLAVITLSLMRAGSAKEAQERAEELNAESLAKLPEISRIVSKNLRVPERVVDAVIVASYLEVRSRLAALETGILSAVDMSREAGRAVWADLRGAA